MDENNSNLPTTVTADSFWGETNLENKDFSVPRIKLAQKEEFAGKFVSNSGTVYDDLICVKLIVPRKSRVLFGANFNDPSRCKSDDFANPSSFVDQPITNSCMTCFAAQWGDDDNRKRDLAKALKRKDANKPLCNETYNLIMADVEWRPFSIAFHKTLLKVVQERLFSRLKEFGSVPPFAVAFNMIPVKKYGSDGSAYYSISFEGFKEVGEADAAIGKKLWKAMSKSAKEHFAKEHEAMDQEHRDEAADFAREVNAENNPPDLTEEDFPY